MFLGREQIPISKIGKVRYFTEACFLREIKTNMSPNSWSKNKQFSISVKQLCFDRQKQMKIGPDSLNHQFIRRFRNEYSSDFSCYFR